MNIIELLKENVKKNYFFFNGDSGQRERVNLRRLATEFLDCDEERHRECLAALIVNYVLLPHAKGSEIAPLVGIMNMFELFENYDYKKNRKHLVHHVYTFLLGLLLYENIDDIRSNISNEMKSTTDRFSSGDEKGEFLFRWRLASLTHDLGNGISLFGNDIDKINKYFFYLQLLSNDEWEPRDNGVDKLLNLNHGCKSLELLDEIDKSNNVSRFFVQLRSNPNKGIYYDHGLMRSLILLKLFDRMYSKYDGQTVDYKGYQVSFERQFFYKSIVNSAYAIAVHNVDFYPQLYQKFWKDLKLYNLEQRPLTFLLKICDTLQEWHKPRASKEMDYLRPEKVELDLSSNKLVIKKFPKKDELKKKIAKYFDCKNTVSIE